MQHFYSFPSQCGRDGARLFPSMKETAETHQVALLLRPEKGLNCFAPDEELLQSSPASHSRLLQSL